MSELQGLQLKLSEFTARNCEVLGIAVDPPETNASVVSDIGLSFRILADPDLKTIDTYDLRHPGGGHTGDVARPASFLLDRDGVVRWRDLTENYRIRPRPETIDRKSVV